ncbi:hypothetical protein DRO31_08120 [Candidatus Bathyarchaeota archaeon]|nr:MAG: hypothetical protein DRO31_08120 [Candidatus Bathyarchaeota archaeon]
MGSMETLRVKEDIEGGLPSIPFGVKLLLGAASVLLVLVLLDVLPPLGDAIAIPIATLLMITIVDHAISTRGSKV